MEACGGSRRRPCTTVTCGQRAVASIALLVVLATHGSACSRWSRLPPLLREAGRKEEAKNGFADVAVTYTIPPHAVVVEGSNVRISFWQGPAMVAGQPAPLRGEDRGPRGFPCVVEGERAGRAARFFLHCTGALVRAEMWLVRCGLAGCLRQGSCRCKPSLPTNTVITTRDLRRCTRSGSMERCRVQARLHRGGQARSSATGPSHRMCPSPLEAAHGDQNTPPAPS